MYTKSWDWWSYSALMAAAKSGHLDIVRALLLAGADPMLVSCTRYDIYQTALELVRTEKDYRVNDKKRKMARLLTNVHVLWRDLNPQCHESAHPCSPEERLKKDDAKRKPSIEAIKRVIDGRERIPPPTKYLCFFCKDIGDHWITDCVKKRKE